MKKVRDFVIYHCVSYYLTPIRKKLREIITVHKIMSIFARFMITLHTAIIKQMYYALEGTAVCPNKMPCPVLFKNDHDLVLPKIIYLFQKVDIV